MWSGQLSAQGCVAPSPLRQYESKPRTSPGMATRLQTVESPGPATPVRWQGPRKQKAFVDSWHHLWNTPTAAVHILFVSPSSKVGERGMLRCYPTTKERAFLLRAGRHGLHSQWQRDRSPVGKPITVPADNLWSGSIQACLRVTTARSSPCWQEI